MTKVSKMIVGFGCITIALAATTVYISKPDFKPQQFENLYVCPWWPACRDPDQQEPTDIVTPVPAGDKDPSNDNNDATQRV